MFNDGRYTVAVALPGPFCFGKVHKDKVGTKGAIFDKCSGRIAVCYVWW